SALNAGTLTADKHVLPVNGSREAPFAFAQALIDRSTPTALIVPPHPFFQLHEGPALLSGAHAYFSHCTAEDTVIPHFSSVPEQVWRDCQLLFICSPGNPTGAVMSAAQLKELIALADEYDFVIASDECYSELYFDEGNPPAGLLQACAEL